MIKSRTILSIVILVWFTSFFTATLQADPSKNKGKSGRANSEENADSVSVDIDLTAMISIGDARDLASSHGIKAGKPLPPGIRKNIALGNPLPPGIQKTRMPDPFINQLPRHQGYQWEQIGTDLVLVAAGSLKVSVVLEDVFD